MIRNGDSRRRYVFIHGNEETARQALIQHMRRHRGTAYLVRNKTRNVLIDAWYIDPNRMFSREGAARNLAALNLTFPPRLLDYLDRERPKFTRAILPPPGELLVAVHNNMAGYSIRDELPISNDASMKLPDKPHDFFLCTDPRDFAALARGPYNVVLQNEPGGMDDGSLSRLSARKNVRYVNLEVKLGQSDTQARMLNFLEDHLSPTS